MDVFKLSLGLLLGCLTMGACQSVPPEWRIGARGAVEAAIGCVEADDPGLSKRQRVARCAGVILIEAGEAVDDVAALPADPAGALDEGASDAAIRPKKIKTAPPSDPPAVPDGPPAPGSTGWRAPCPDTEPQCKGWRYRYKHKRA